MIFSTVTKPEATVRWLFEDASGFAKSTNFQLISHWFKFTKENLLWIFKLPLKSSSILLFEITTGDQISLTASELPFFSPLGPTIPSGALLP